MIRHNEGYNQVLETLKRYSSEQRPMDLSDIHDKILKDYECERKTVSRALEKLREEYGFKDDEGVWPDEKCKLHFEVVNRSSSLIYKKYWIEIHDDSLTDDELMFLMDAVLFSKHIDQKKTDEITKKLRNLSAKKHSDRFEIFSKINEKTVPAANDYFGVFGTIAAAIHMEKMISFVVNEYGTDKKLHPVSDEPVEVSPYRIVESDGHNYLLCSKKDVLTLTSYRVDRITDVRILDKEIRRTDAKREAVLHPQQYLLEHRYLYSGKPVGITLRVDKSILGDVIDSFGTGIAIERAHHTVNRLTVRLKSNERDIIEWAMKYAGSAVVIDPDYIRDEICDRARLIARSHRSIETDIEYYEQIEKARDTHRLNLRDLDLNGQDSYMDLDGIRSAVFYNNGIKDFSFLASYEDLVELTIGRNKISDPGVISGLGNLMILGLAGTGITNLDFLTGLDRLRWLTLNEYELENVEAVYSLENLRFLTVNKAIAPLFDKDRLRSVYGPSFEFSVEEYPGIAAAHVSHLHLSTTKLPKNEERFRKRDLELMNSLTNVEVTDMASRTLLSSHIYTGNDSFKKYSKMFYLAGDTCEGNERVEIYDDLSRYTGDEYTWFITHEGEIGERMAEDDMGKIYAISIFKRDHGLKLIGMARRNPSKEENTQRLGQKIYFGMYAHIRYILANNIGWAEISGELEAVFGRAAALIDVIDPVFLAEHSLFTDIEIDPDGYHYYRRIEGSKTPSKKIAYGHIELS